MATRRKGEQGAPDAGRNARLVAYYVSLAGGCVMGVISAHSNDLRGDLGCTAHCEASIRTLRNALGIVAAPVAGAFSDTHGRRVALVVSCVVMIASYAVWATATSIGAFVLYNALNGAAGLGLTFTVCKALVADGTAPEDKIETQGILGAAAGCGVILGPAIAVVFLHTQAEAAAAAIAVQLSALAVLLLVPFESAPPAGKADSGSADADGGAADGDGAGGGGGGGGGVGSRSGGGGVGSSSSSRRSRSALSRVPLVGDLADAARRVWDELRHATPAEVVLVGARFAISLGYHVFLTGFYDMLKGRGLLATPRAWSMYMASMGVLYAVTQRAAAGPLSHHPRRPAVLASVGCIALGRVGAFALAYTEPTLYASFGAAVVGVALFNTLVNGQASRIAARDATGGLMGLLQSAEDFSGLVGPWVGSVAYEAHATGPLAVCVVLYVVVAATLAAEWPVVVAEAEAGRRPAGPAKPKAE